MEDLVFKSLFSDEGEKVSPVVAEESHAYLTLAVFTPYATFSFASRDECISLRTARPFFPH
jgi:hypothetical protein